MEVVRWATSRGAKWSCKDELIHEEYWDNFMSKTCVFIRDDVLYYSSISYFSSNYKRINMLDMEQFRRHTEDGSIELFEDYL